MAVTGPSAGTEDRVLAEICSENLGVYRASPIRLREDVSQEAQISNDYRGRLIYELLQNADDAMSGQATHDDRIVFRLTDTDLWVGNSGRPLNELDVKGLCGIGASSKGDAVGRRRASIGHKGMGFKSVLEITESPQVVSDDHAFQMSAEFARTPIDQLMAELEEARPRRVPVMRFPSPLPDAPDYWHELRGSGIQTLFRFPLRAELTDEQRSLLADRLLALPVTTILFLKHLERVEVVVETKTRSEGYLWTVNRTRKTETVWEPCTGLLETGIYKVRIASAAGEAHQFLLAHNAEVEIGEHRGGLDSYAWEGVEVSDVSVAALLDGGSPKDLPAAWRHFHVFLPTSEPCEYPLLVNGAFVSDLSRQEIRVSEEATDYNQFLMRRVAALFRDVLATQLQTDGVSTAEILGLLDRGAEAPGVAAPTAAGQALYEAMRLELSAHPFLPLEGTDERLALDACVVPPLGPNSAVGEEFRELLPAAVSFEDRRFPDPSVCGSELARIAVDHGALSLPPAEAAKVLASGDLQGVPLEYHESGALLRVDPVLRVLEGLWEGLDWADKDDFAASVRREPLFPIGEQEGVVQRVVTDGIACFYPPRTLKGAVPLEYLSFLMQDLCWGALRPSARNEILRDQLVAWQALFELRDFKFPDVMRASVLPALELEPDEEGRRRLDRLQNLNSLAAICQLSGRTPDSSRPLRYERLGSNRALFNLSRLPIPCRSRNGAEFEWRPAYQVYLGEDWVGKASVERVLSIARERGASVPEVPFLAGPEHFEGILARFSHLEEAVESEENDEDEVGLEEDEEAPPDQVERDRWIDFFTWIGVNPVIRPVHFHDVEDRAAGWLTTKNFHRPNGWAFQALAPSVWDEFREVAFQSVADDVPERSAIPYFYRVHDLEHIVPLLKAAAEDGSSEISSALFAHLALNWTHLERFTKAEAAVVPSDRVPSMRSKPPRPYDDELKEIGDDLWVIRLRTHDWCPATHGPRRPGRVWLRTAEVERRFGRQGSDAGDLLPLLDVDAELTKRGGRDLAQTLGIRAELTPSSFAPEDARGLLNRLVEIFGKPAARGAPRERDLRQVIRPAYRNLMELLSDSEKDTSPAFAAAILAGSPLLVHDGRANYRFEPAERVLYADRPGTRERLGNPEDLWTFVLEAARVAKKPLTTLLNVRVLEDELTWTPQPGDSALDSAGVAEFRAQLQELAPYLLARLGAERQDEQLVAQDSRRLRDFIGAIEPVTELAVRCRLEDRELGATVSRDAFIDIAARGLTAFVVWGSTPWPPTAPEEAEALATALSDLLGAGYFEAFLALVNSRSHESRLRLLHLAGAPTDLEAVREALMGLHPGPDESERGPIEPVKTAGESTSEEPPIPPSETGVAPAPRKTPLFRPDELLIDGMPVIIAGEGSGPSSIGRGNAGTGQRGGSTTYGGYTDMGELDRLGMYVALTFERNRLRREGLSDAEIFDPDDADEKSGALVFGVSTLEAIDRAAASSQLFATALDKLAKHGLSPQAPGFDILTLNPERPDHLDRLIELKSSGLSARIQEMTWNEWKTARNSELRKLFYLYLVGNLRSDLGDAAPFIRAVHDPFATIWAEEIQHDSHSRKVQLNVSQFKAAEHLDLGVRQPNGEPTAVSSTPDAEEFEPVENSDG
jgi:hypothetical protein